MKRITLLLTLLVCSCTAPKFIVTGKTATDTDGNCLLSLQPLNKQAHVKYAHITTALVDCWDYDINDTLTLTRREFTNFKRTKP